MLDENVGQIANLVVVAMKNFCSSEAILNRACLVLHNLSLNEEYHRSHAVDAELPTRCWSGASANYRHDQVLQQSAGGDAAEAAARPRRTTATSGCASWRPSVPSSRAQLEQVRREALNMLDETEAVAARAS